MNTARTFGLFGNIEKSTAVDALRQTVAYLDRRGIGYAIEQDIAALLPTSDSVVRHAASRADIAAAVDVVIVFGGDGTLLASIQHTLPHDTPVLGVNLGKLGFLSDVGVDEVFWAVEEILAGRFHVERRMTLSGRRRGETRQWHALNDIVLAKSGRTKVISIDAYVNDQFLASFFADGIIISTPTGSTAYSLATGGPVVVPSSNVIVISPISAHTLTARPVIVASDSVITVCARTEEGSAFAMADGVAILDEQASIELEISRGAHSAALVKGLGPRYFETLRAKLSWAQDGRIRPDGAGASRT
ncbi:MAG: NAD(+)/NADH kinase [Bacteroidota bacterium]|jgi:NAD+ kinase|nr:NAD(+)/NADH kinase [Bacteroidota bacterium]